GMRGGRLGGGKGGGRGRGLAQSKLSCRGCSRGVKLGAPIRNDARGAAGKNVGECREVRHRGRLTAVERVLDGCAPVPGLEINKAQHVAGSDLEAERMPL